MATPENPETPHSDTARVAEALHNTRQRLGRPGDAASDWQQAEKIVQSPLRTALFKLNQPLLRLRPSTRRAMTFVGQDIPRWIFVSLPQVEMVKLVALPLILAGATSIITRQLQWEANQTATLDAYFDHLEELIFNHGLLNDEPNKGALVLARGRTIAALQKLDIHRRQQLMVFLQASNLVAREIGFNEEGDPIFVEGSEPVMIFAGANLSGIDLRGIQMRAAILDGANLKNANLSGADLERANLAEADLSGANLKNAYLEGIVLAGANLTGTYFGGAFLVNANLARAYLEGANLRGANLAGAYFDRTFFADANLSRTYFGDAYLSASYLVNANLSGANLSGANLSGANLSGANLSGANLSGANLSGANLSGSYVDQKQLIYAKLCKTSLPSDITLDPNRDCESLGIATE